MVVVGTMDHTSPWARGRNGSGTRRPEQYKYPSWTTQEKGIEIIERVSLVIKKSLIQSFTVEKQQ